MNKQLIFIDSQVENYQSLVEGKNSEAEVVVLKATENGIEKITNILKKRTHLEAIHIVSHGEDAKFKAGELVSKY